jgi:hypothetical protein
MRLSPAAFSTALLIPFSSFPLLHGRRASGLGELYLSLPVPLCPTEGYDAASEKNASSRLPTLVRWPPRQHCLVDRHNCGSALDNDADEVPGLSCPRRPVHATALDAVPPLPSFEPCERIHTTSLRLQPWSLNTASAR